MNISSENSGNFSALIAKTSQETSITNCRKVPNSRVHSSFAFDDFSNNKENQITQRDTRK